MSPGWNKERRLREEEAALKKEEDALKQPAELRVAADESARHVRQLYFTFLLFAFYVAVIVFSTTDEQLLKETGTKLPLLNVELPLVGFYIFVPWLVLIFHAHLLNQFFLLSRKLFHLDQALESLPPQLERLQRELPFPLVFSHLIVGTHHSRLIRWAFRAAVVFIILLTPVTLLAAIQYKFLPYHGEGITINHQLVFTLDLLLLWAFWPRLFSPSDRWRDWWSHSRRGVSQQPLSRRGCRKNDGTTCQSVNLNHRDTENAENRPVPFSVSSVSLWFERTFATPSRRRWGILVSRILGVLVATGLLLVGSWSLLVPHVGDIEKRLAEREQGWSCTYGNAERKEGLFCIHRNLELRERTLVRKKPPVELLSAARKTKGDTEAEAKVWLKDGEALDLRGRDLRYADFYESKLWNADLRDTQLQHATLQGANLRGARLHEARLQDADLQRARLQDANLWVAQLQGANLYEAELQGAVLREAQLQGAVLFGAQLQGTVLLGAQMQGANLFGAQLQGAVLQWAQLQGADLLQTQLQIADLRGAQLQGADLRGARLQGANLGGMELGGGSILWTQLQGADLRGARLQGADLSSANLQGADLEGAQLQGADLRKARVYGTDFRETELSLADLQGLRSPVVEWKGLLSVFSEIEELEEMLKQEGEHWFRYRREWVAEAIDRFWSNAFDLPLVPKAISPLQGFDVMHDQEGLFAAWPAPPDVEQEHVEYRAGLACDDQYIAKGMWRRAKKTEWNKGDPVLEEALREQAKSKGCSVLAEVVDE